MSRTPSLADVFHKALDNQLLDMHFSIPARVTRYDNTKQLVDAQPLIKTAYLDEEEAQVVERLPVVTNVPVMFMSGGGFRLTLPVAVGDTVWLFFSEASLDKWLSQGGEVDPVDYRRNALTDAVAFPGVRDFAHALASAPASTLSLGKDGGGPTIEITGSQIQAGGTQQLALFVDFTQVREFLKEQFDTALGHKHTCSAAGSPSGPPIAGSGEGTGFAVPEGTGTSTLRGA